MRIRISAVIAGTAAAALALSACGGGGAGSASSSGNTVKVGAWFPLTGPLAAYGVERAGADAYFKMVNEAGGINGKKIEYIVKDHASDSQQTVQIARELISKDNVVAIVAANGTAQTEATFPFVLQQSKVPILDVLGGSASWYDKPREGLFGFQTLYEDQAAAVGAWAADDGAKKILVVHSDPAAFVNVAKEVGPAAKKINPSVNVSLLPVKFPSTDYSPVVSQIKAQKPDAVVLILASPDAAAYMKEAKLQGLAAPTYGYAPTVAASTLTLAGDAAEGFKAVQLVKSVNDPDPSIKEFRAAMAKYEPNAHADTIELWGWAAAKVFVQTAKTIKSDITSQSLMAAFEKATNIDPGVAPVMNYSKAQHLGTRQVQKVVVKNGKFVSVGGFYTPPTRK
jgi:branched-chain amino acid transport system substrate-binding protein